jgi:hypothetical protein
VTKAAATVLLYLDRYLKENPKQRRELARLYKKATGKEINLSLLWVHTRRKSEPSMSVSIVYFDFLVRAGELTPTAEPGRLFEYQHEDWLEVKK